MATQVIKVGTTGSDSRRVLEALTPLVGVTAPTKHADYIGQMYIDTVASKAYVSVAVDSSTASNDWKLITAAV